MRFKDCPVCGNEFFVNKKLKYIGCPLKYIRCPYCRTKLNILRHYHKGKTIIQLYPDS